MKIDFVRSGGFTGLRLALAIDTKDLEADEASRLRQLVEAADFFELDVTAVSVTPAPDRFEYRLAIESQVWGRRALVLAESAVPDEVRPLLDYLTALAKRRQKPNQAGNSARSHSN